jgi:hypothetical protein
LLPVGQVCAALTSVNSLSKDTHSVPHTKLGVRYAHKDTQLASECQAAKTVDTRQTLYTLLAVCVSWLV